MSLDLKDNKPHVDYQLWAMAHIEPERSKSGRFLTLSLLVHVGFILAAGMMAVPLNEKIQTETISFEIEGSSPVLEQAQGVLEPASLPEIAETPREAAVTPSAPVAEEEVFVPPSKPRTAAKPPMPVVQKQKVSEMARADLRKMAPAAKPSMSEAPKVATIDDIDAPEVETSPEDGASAFAPTAFNEDLDQDLQEVDNKQSHALAAEKNKLDQEADALDSQNEEALENASQANQEKLAAIEAANAARRERDNQAIAAAMSQENEAREAAARAAAAKQAAAAAAEAKAREKMAAGFGDGEGSGSAGTPNGVRSLDQLRQMPGNPIPQYSQQERLQRQAGQVTFYAYVKKDGTLTGFRQTASTGYSNLDSKTLTALQQWRFYPGQEGWVELPFSWDLKGGAQSVDGLLRTKRSDLSGR